MSCDDNTRLVMKGIRHGACDYLIKPVRDEELKNIWQHVVRKMRNGNKEHDHSGSMEDHDCRKRAIDDGADVVNKAQKKRIYSKDEDDIDLDNDDSTTSKKPRVVWSVELHQQFVAAVNQLGIDKAVPKRILEMMNVPNLTRENVASHLQKFRLYLNRLSQQQGLPTSYCGPVEQNMKLIFATSSQLPPQTLAELLSQPSGNLILPVIDKRALFIEPRRRPINVQPSCLVIPSQSLPNFQAAKSPVSVNQNCSFRNPALDYNRSLLQSTNSSGVGQSLGVEYKQVTMPFEFGAASYVSSISSCSRIGNISQRKQFVDNNGNKVKHEPNMNLMENVKKRLPPI